MPKLSPDILAERRANIVRAARQCFATHGMAVSVDEICAAAGVSKGAFYGYFKSKDAVIRALASDHAGAIGSLGEMDGLTALGDRLFAYAHRGDPASSRLELEAWTHSLSQPALRAILERNMSLMRAALARGVAGRAGDRVDEVAGILQVFAAGLVVTTALTEGRSDRDLRTALSHLIDCLIPHRPLDD